MADEKNDQPFGSQTMGATNGKDVLYGWLVGRAAADLGLAQAIAASEAQRIEQTKRLEQALLGQMRELRDSQATIAASSVNGGEVDRLKDQVQQFGERQNFLEAQQLTIGQIESQLSAKIRELEVRIEQPLAPMADTELSALRAEMAALGERIARAEAIATREPASVDDHAAEDRIVRFVREQTEPLKDQLAEQQRKQTNSTSDFKILETAFWQKLDAMQQEIREKAALLELRDGELSELRVQLAGMAQRLDLIAITPSSETSVNEREAERAQWQRDFDERLTTRLRELGDEIRGKLHGVTSAKVDHEQLRSETLALTARLSQLEQSHQEANKGAAAQARDAYQATVALAGEITAMKVALSEQQYSKPNDVLAHGVEEMLRGPIDELRGEIQALMQRQIHSESLALQTQALVTQETGQIRGGLKVDLELIEARLKEREARDVALQGMEAERDLRLRELQNQSARGALALDQRDGELRDLKKQVQLLAQQLGQIGQAATAVSLSRSDAVAASLPAASLSSEAPALQPAELRSNASVDSVVNLFQAAAPDDGPTPVRSKLSAIDLHDRLSADIERKRAELREKSGRWKVRQS